jgi:hypothetical protein
MPYRIQPVIPMQARTLKTSANDGAGNVGVRRETGPAAPIRLGYDSRVSSAPRPLPRTIASRETAYLARTRLI